MCVHEMTYFTHCIFRYVFTKHTGNINITLVVLAGSSYPMRSYIFCQEFEVVDLKKIADSYVHVKVCNFNPDKRQFISC